LFLSNVIENVVRKFLNHHFTSDSSQGAANRDNCLYFKLPYIGPFSITRQRIKKLVSIFCTDLDIKLVLVWGHGSYPCRFTIAFIHFHVQAVVPVMLVKPTDTSPLASANISPLTNIPTSLNTEKF